MNATITTPETEIFGRIDENGNVTVLHAEDGSPVTRLALSSGYVWPTGSDVSGEHEHAAGITISREDAERIDLEIED